MAKKRPFYRHRKFHKSRDTYHMPPGIFPDVTYAKFQYTEVRTLSTTISSSQFIAQHTWVLNGMYSPDYDASGGQPQYYNTFFGTNGGPEPYHQYRVLGCKVKAEFQNNQSTGDTQGWVALFAAPRANAIMAPTDTDEFFERKDVFRKFITVDEAGKPYATIEKYFNLKELMGIKDLADEPGTAGTYNTNPPLQSFIQALYHPTKDVTSAIQVVFTMTFYCQMFDRNNRAPDQLQDIDPNGGAIPLVDLPPPPPPVECGDKARSAAPKAVAAKR